LRQATGTFSRRKLAASGAAGAPFKPQDVIAGRYLVHDVIGSGPLGYVFRVHDKAADVDSALKLIHGHLCQSDDDRRLLSESLRVGKRLSQPNLARIYEDGVEKGQAFFTTQMLYGMSLRKIIDLRLSKKQFFQLGEIEPILAQLCQALDAVHRLGVHGNVRPENMLVLPDMLKLTDFGLPLALPRFPVVQAMKTANVALYFAPEFKVGSTVDLRADIYAMGVLLGEMLTGQVPDGSPVDLESVNSSVSSAVAGFYRKAVNQSPFLRFDSAMVFLREFRSITAGQLQPGVPLGLDVPATGSGRKKVESERSGASSYSKPPPPVPDEEESFPDATQPVDSTQIKAILEGIEKQAKARAAAAAINEGSSPGMPPRTVVPSISIPPLPPPQFSAPPETTAMAMPLGSQGDEKGALTALNWSYVVGLIVSGLAIGALAGYFVLGRTVQAEPLPVRPAAVPDATAKARANEEAARLMMPSTVVADASVAERVPTPAVVARPAEKSPVAAKGAGADEVKAKEKKEVSAPAVAPANLGGDGNCFEGMKLVSGGAFRMGTSADDAMVGFDEKPLTAVFVDAFCIDIFEFPNRKGSTPRTSLTHGEAQRECQVQGKRLCAEAEWEKACKGPGNAKWPYGNTFDPARCATEDDSGESRSLSVSGQYGRCKSDFGVADLSGNVAEWTQERTIKGGSFASGDYAVRCASRKSGGGFNKSSEVGFRCCASPRK
jgi:eukaryotic-like serine/threonine-protein kinase